MAEAAVRGYQSDSLKYGYRILACAKHFVADGGTQSGTDQGNSVMNETQLRSIHLKPYYSAIDMKVGSVMASFNSWNGAKCHGNKYLLTDVLKTEMGFKGFVVSDWKGINQLATFKDAVAQSVNAGVDMAMQPDDYRYFIQYLTEAVNNGIVSEDRINDAVSRILRIKFQMGLFEHPYVENSLIDSVGNAYHCQVARKAVRESVVLLKNNSLLPLTKNLKVVVAGSRADDIGVQCGGWTISWQGQRGNITPGTTIKQAIENVVGTSSVSYTSTTNIPDGDVAVVVIGESPYAEGSGDISYGNQRFYISNEDQQIINAIMSKGMPMVAVVLSGRPIMLGNLIADADAIIAAWLPGTEGQGIADVLFGDYDPIGKLSHTWPKDENQIPINYGDSNYDPLFAFGYGMTFGDTSVPPSELSSNIEIFPNPAQDFIHVKLTQSRTGYLIVRNLNGQMIFKNILSNKLTSFSLDKLTSGIYVVEFNDGKNKIIKKLVKR